MTAPIPRLKARWWSRPQTAFRAIVERDGRFLLARLPEGVFEVAVLRPTYEPGRYPPVEIEPRKPPQDVGVVRLERSAPGAIEVPGYAMLVGEESSADVEVSFIDELDPEQVLGPSKTADDGSVVRLSRAWFREANGGLLDRAEITIHIEDGRAFLRTTPDRYDLLVLEPLQAWSAGTSSLYSREFYEDAKRVLKPGALLLQWIPFTGKARRRRKRWCEAARKYSRTRRCGSRERKGS
jgi:hypothetical protein